jgi:hypothetical protein
VEQLAVKKLPFFPEEGESRHCAVSEPAGSEAEDMRGSKTTKHIFICLSSATKLISGLDSAPCISIDPGTATWQTLHLEDSNSRISPGTPSNREVQHQIINFMGSGGLQRSEAEFFRYRNTQIQHQNEWKGLMNEAPSFMTPIMGKNKKEKCSKLGKEKQKNLELKETINAMNEIGTTAEKLNPNLKNKETSKCSTNNEAKIKEVIDGKKIKGSSFSPSGEGQKQVDVSLDQMSKTNQTIDQLEHPATEIASIHQNRAGIPAWGKKQDFIVGKSDFPQFPTFCEPKNNQNMNFCLPLFANDHDENVGSHKKNFINKEIYKTENQKIYTIDKTLGDMIDVDSDNYDANRN